MGELFRRFRPETELSWTGERLVPRVEGAIESEHLHRYFLARDLCRNKRVLDIAAGEGYGSALLAQTAVKVFGVERNAEAVEHAQRSYRVDHLRFLQGSATEIPIEDGAVDVVVSFETLEHFLDHARFFSEVRRVLQPDGFLLISTPDVDVYSSRGTAPNPFHVRELTRHDFVESLGAVFQNVAILRQRVMVGSALLPETAACIAAKDTRVYEQRSRDTFESHHYLARAPYLISVASNAPLPAIGASLYVEDVLPGELPGEIQDELRRLKDMEAEVPQQRRALADREAALADTQAVVKQTKLDLGRVQAENEELKKIVATLDAQITLTRESLHTKDAECERLLKAEAAAREAKLVVAAERKKNVDYEQVVRERDELLDRTSVLRRQLESAALIDRQQSLIVRRLQLSFNTQSKALLRANETEQKLTEVCRIARAEQASTLNRYRQVSSELRRLRGGQDDDISNGLNVQGGEPDSLTRQLEQQRREVRDLKNQLDQQIALTNRVAGLLIPVWMRKLLPSSLRNSDRLRRAVGAKAMSSSDS